MRPGPYSESPADELAALRGAITTCLDARDDSDPLAEAQARRRLDALLGRAPRQGGSARAVRLMHEMSEAHRVGTSQPAALAGSAARRMGLGGGFGTRGEG